MISTVFNAADADAIADAAQLVAGASAILVNAGAGMGVDSGLPDFRGKEGFWRAYPPLRAAGIGFSEIANATCFDTDPRLAWGFYGHRLALYRRTRPHAGFGLLRQWAETAPQGYMVCTSNVDGQFEAAGFAPDRIYTCHGSIHLLQCTRPCSDAVWPAIDVRVEVDERTCTWTAPLPTCIRCGALARPNILMFDDGAWVSTAAENAHERLQAWLSRTSAPLVIEIGAGTHANSVRAMSDAVVRRRGRLIRINPDGDAGDSADVVLAMPALRALEAIARCRATGAGTLRATGLAAADEAQPAAERTFQRRLALLALLPEGESDSGGIGAGALAGLLAARGYACVRRTVERDLQALRAAAPLLQALGIAVVERSDPGHSHARLWSRRRAG